MSISFLDMIEKHKLTLPSSKQEIVIRPILVKEEKILLIGKDTKENKDFLNSILQVVQNCTLTENFNWNDKSFADFSYVFIELRKISKGESLDINLFCKNEKCEHFKNKPVKKRLQIDNITYIKNQDEKYSRIIKINDNIAVELIPLKVDFVTSNNTSSLLTDMSVYDFETLYNMIKYHIKAIIKNEERFEELTDEDKTNFIDSLKKKDFITLSEWFIKEPHPEIKIEWECIDCKTMNVIEEVDIINFFDLS